MQKRTEQDEEGKLEADDDKLCQVVPTAWVGSTCCGMTTDVLADSAQMDESSARVILEAAALAFFCSSRIAWMAFSSVSASSFSSSPSWSNALVRASRCL